MGKYRDFDPLDPLPADWTDAWQEFWSTLTSNFNLRIKPTDLTVLQVVAGAGNDQVGITIEASPRFIAATIERASPGGGVARNLDVWVTSTANIFTPGSPGEVDTTNYAFALAITETGVPPGGVAIKRKIATAHWDGAKFTFITPLWLFAAPIGAAGGALSGSYPNPDLADHAVTAAKIAAGQTPTFLDLYISGAFAGLHSIGGGAYYYAQTAQHYFENSGGGWGTVHAGSFVTESDERFKEDIETVTNALETLGRLRGVKFRRDGEERIQLGVLAQEVKKVLPEAVIEHEVSLDEGETVETRLAVDIGGLVGLLVQAVGELTARHESLEVRVAALEG